MGLSLIISIVALIFGVIALCIGIYSVIQIEAQKRSTHTIEWRPLDLDEPLKGAANKKGADPSKELYSKGFAPADPLEQYDDEEMI